MATPSRLRQQVEKVRPSLQARLLRSLLLRFRLLRIQERLLRHRLPRRSRLRNLQLQDRDVWLLILWAPPPKLQARIPKLHGAGVSFQP
jgi:hypothetical protein